MLKKTGNEALEKAQALTPNTGEERQELLKLYRQVLSKAQSSLSEKDIKDIKSAFVLASEAHEGMRRHSGEPYMYHPLRVALICVEEIGLTHATTIISCFLHDTVEDTELSLGEVEKRFGPKVAEITDGLTKISTLFEKGKSEQAENFRKVLLTLSKDIRVILIKMADRLHNMRTLQSLPRHKQIRIASETLYLYAPLAHRMGLYAIKSELEDLYLKHTEPETFRHIAKKVQQSKAEREKFVRNFIAPVRRMISEHGIKADIKGRTKSIYSIWRKMQVQKIPFEDIYDLFAIRIIVDTDEAHEKEVCWQIYSVITDFYNPNPDRLKDWISTPKANGYESLHTTVMSDQGQWVEIQIRSQRMDQIAERGYAAHWRYKETRGTQKKRRESMLDQWLLRVRDFLDRRGQGSAVDFVRDFRSDLHTGEVYAFTPKGELKVLNQGATLLDFAFEIHSDIGRTCMGGKVNQRIESLDYVLKNGDQIEILTSPRQKPKEKWLRFAVTSKARGSIKQYLQDDRKGLIKKGEQLLKSKLAKDKTSKTQSSKEVFDNMANYFHLSNQSELFYQVGKGLVSITRLGKILPKIASKAARKNISPGSLSEEKKHTKASPSSIVVGETYEGDIKYKLAPCCSPISGDEVFGYVTSQEGIKIHRTSCHNAPELLSQHGDKIVRAQWSENLRIQSIATLSLRGFDRRGMTRDIMQIVSEELEINAQSIYLNARDSVFEGEIKLYIDNTQRLNKLIGKLKDVKSMVNVVRLD